MSKTKAIQIPTDVQMAEAALAGARAAHEELRAALARADDDIRSKMAALDKAQAVADRDEPKAYIVRPYLSSKAEREAVVIARRTESTIWTRPIGTSNEVEQWRKSAHGDGRKRWRDYPGPCMRWLEIPGEEA